MKEQLVNIFKIIFIWKKKLFYSSKAARLRLGIFSSTFFFIYFSLEIITCAKDFGSDKSKTQLFLNAACLLIYLIFLGNVISGGFLDLCRFFDITIEVLNIIIGFISILTTDIVLDLIFKKTQTTDSCKNFNASIQSKLNKN